MYLGHAAHNFKILETIWLNKEVPSLLGGAAGSWKIDRLNSCLRLGASNIAKGAIIVAKGVAIDQPRYMCSFIKC